MGASNRKKVNTVFGSLFNFGYQYFFCYVLVVTSIVGVESMATAHLTLEHKQFISPDISAEPVNQFFHMQLRRNLLTWEYRKLVAIPALWTLKSDLNIDLLIQWNYKFIDGCKQQFLADPNIHILCYRTISLKTVWSLVAPKFNHPWFARIPVLHRWSVFWITHSIWRLSYGAAQVSISVLVNDSRQRSFYIKTQPYHSPGCWLRWCKILHYGELILMGKQETILLDFCGINHVHWLFTEPKIPNSIRCMRATKMWYLVSVSHQKWALGSESRLGPTRNYRTNASARNRAHFLGLTQL